MAAAEVPQAGIAPLHRSTLTVLFSCMWFNTAVTCCVMLPRPAQVLETSFRTACQRGRLETVQALLAVDGRLIGSVDTVSMLSPF